MLTAPEPTRIRLWFERPPLSGRGGALALGIRTGADGGVSCWPPPEKTGVPGRNSFPPGMPTSSSTVWFTSCWEALPSCHDKLLHAADRSCPQDGGHLAGRGPALSIWVPAGPPPSGSVQAPSPPPARWLFLANGGPLPHSPALCRMLGLASAHPAISQTWLTHCLPEDTFPDFQPGSGPHHPLMELPAASLGQTSNTPAALG